MKPAKTTALLFASLPWVAEKHSGIAQCLCYMAVNCSSPIKIKDLEQVAGLSRRGLQKAFQKHAGLSPGQVLRHLRVEHAKRLLMETELGLEEIAVRSGYRSMNTFCIAFRQVVGMPPKKFQRQASLSTYLRCQRNRAQTTSRTEAGNAEKERNAISSLSAFKQWGNGRIRRRTSGLNGKAGKSVSTAK